MIDNWYKRANDDSSIKEDADIISEKPAKKQKKIYDPNIPKENQHANCYKLVYELVARNRFDTKNRKKNMVIVHGIPTGQGAINGLRYGHAWAEYQLEMPDITNMNPKANLSTQDFEVWMVADPSAKINGIPRQLYYGVGNINPSETVRYTCDEALSKMHESGHYGPWDDRILDAAHSEFEKTENE